MGVLSILNLAASIIIIKLLSNQNKKLDIIMAKQEQFDAAITRLNSATNEIASDLKALREEIKDTVSQESLDTLDANVSTLEALGKDPENPVPEEKA